MKDTLCRIQASFQDDLAAHEEVAMTTAAMSHSLDQNSNSKCCEKNLIKAKEQTKVNKIVDCPLFSISSIQSNMFYVLYGVFSCFHRYLEMHFFLSMRSFTPSTIMYVTYVQCSAYREIFVSQNKLTPHMFWYMFTI